MSLTNNASMPLTDIAERWATYSGTDSTDQILSSLLKAVWRGEFADSALVADPRCVMDALFPEGHSESPPASADEQMTRAYIAECLANSPDFTSECAVGQALHAVLFGRSEIVDGKARQTAPYDATILASYSISDYSSGQRKIIECLKLTPDGLALWLHRHHPKEQWLQARFQVPVNSGESKAKRAAIESESGSTITKDPARTDARRYLSISQAKTWYLSRVREYNDKGVIPSRQDDERDGLAAGISTPQVRRLRTEFAPPEWKKQGRRKTGEKN